VYFSDVIDQPRIRIVAPGALVSNRILVHIEVTGRTIRFRLFKLQRGVTIPAIYDFVLALKCKTCSAVIE
jgi:hypothetical protein